MEPLEEVGGREFKVVGRVWWMVGSGGGRGEEWGGVGRHPEGEERERGG